MKFRAANAFFRAVCTFFFCFCARSSPRSSGRVKFVHFISMFAHICFVCVRQGDSVVTRTHARTLARSLVLMHARKLAHTHTHTQTMSARMQSEIDGLHKHEEAEKETVMSRENQLQARIQELEVQ